MLIRLVTTLLALSFASNAFAVLHVNCSNENTFLKLNETTTNQAGERVAEIFMNFKDVNRILNLPEVILHQYKEGILVSESTGPQAVLLNLTETLQESQAELPKPEAQEVQDSTNVSKVVSEKIVTASVQLDGKQIRENVILKCEK